MTYLPLCNFTALIYLFKKQNQVAQLLRALAAHPEDLDLIHRTYMVAAKSL